MKAALLLALRTTLGMLLVIWGVVKIVASDRATAISDNFYGGLLSLDSLIPLLGIAQVALGLLVVVGLFRTITYSLQAVILVGGAIAIWRFILDPLGMYLMPQEQAQLLFYPSSIIAVASLIMLAFKSDDKFALDELRGARHEVAEA